MRVGKPTGAGAVSFNFTPVIDVVFDLLIFFVLTAQFSVLEMEEVTLPPSSTGELRDHAEFLNVVINVVTPDDPQIMVMGQTLTYPDLVEMLTQMREKSDSQGQKMNVILRADAETPFEKVALIMLAAGNAKIPGWWMQVDVSDEAQKELAAEAASK
jgi:biopolymer transport protein ExbD